MNFGDSLLDEVIIIRVLQDCNKWIEIEICIRSCLVCIHIFDLFVGLKVILGFLWNTRKEIIFYIVYISII